MTNIAGKASAVNRMNGSYGQSRPTHAIHPDPEEISFFTYRLDVLSHWPQTHRREALIAATLDRLRMLGMDRD
jgi:hypothetical protein